MLLSIESSCDETSVALFDVAEDYLSHGLSISKVYKGQIIKSQVDFHSEYGGVVPELAARQHMQSLPALVDLLLSKHNIGFTDLKYIAVTSGPGLKGCLLVGLSYAKGLSEALNIPLIPINHLEGHVLSFSLEHDDENMYPLLCLLVSGGHSEIIKVEAVGKYIILCQTGDDAAGEAFDKIGTLLGIAYPAGRELSELAKSGKKGEYTFPEGVQRDYDAFSYSGLKTSVRRTVELEKVKSSELSLETKCNISYSVQDAIVSSLTKKLAYWCQQVGPKSIVLAGGVAANSELRTRVRKLAQDNNIPVMIPAHEFCTDNAAMIGAAAIMRMKNNLVNFNSLNEMRLVGAKARWSLEEIQNG